MPPLGIIRILLVVIRYLANNDRDISHLTDQVIVNNQIKQDAFSNLKELLIQREMHNVLHVLRETIRGNFDVLQEYRQIFNRVHNDPNHDQWQRYQYTQNNNPVRQEVTGRTDNGNVLATESSNDIQQGRFYGAASPDRSIPSTNPQRSQNGYQPTARPQGGHRKTSQLENLSFRSPHVPPQVPVFPRSSVSLSRPEQPRGSRHCCSCENDIQDIQNSYPLWSRIGEMMKLLTHLQRQRFIRAVHNYDPDILYPLRFYTFPSSDMVDAFIVTRLHQYHSNRNKCVLCLLNYAFQYIGCGYLADEIRHIRSRMRENLTIFAA